MTDYCWNHDSVIIVWQYQQTSKNHGDTCWNSSSEVDEGNNRQGIGHHLLKATLQWWLRTITAVIPATEMGTNTTFSKVWMIGFWPQELRQLENLRAGFQAEGWKEIFTINSLLFKIGHMSQRTHPCIIHLVLQNHQMTSPSHQGECSTNNTQDTSWDTATLSIK